MLITRHRDRPGMVGRIGPMLGEADVNISAMHLARSRAARGRADDPRPRRRRARPRSRRPSATRTRSSTCGRSGWAASADAVPGDDASSLVPDRLDATLVLVRHGESRVHRRGPVPGPGRHAAVRRRGRRQAALVARAARAPARPAGAARPDGPPLEIVHSPLGERPRRPRRSPRRIAAPAPAERRPARRRASLEIGQGEWEGLHRDEIAARWADVLATLAARPTRGMGARRRVARRRPGPRPAGAGGVLDRLAAGGVPGTLDRAQVAGYGDAPATHPWSIVVGHDGVFKVALLTLFDLPLERFWMWSMDLCAITVVEFRGGRPVLRAPQPDRPPRAAARRGGPGDAGGAEPQRRALGASRSRDRSAARSRIGRRRRRRVASRSSWTRSRR